MRGLEKQRVEENNEQLYRRLQMTGQAARDKDKRVGGKLNLVYLCLFVAGKTAWTWRSQPADSPKKWMSL